MSGPRIVLHVGAPKTATTYIQKRFAANQDHLRRHGLHYPRLPVVDRMAGNAKLLATVMGREPSPSFQRAFPAINPSLLDPAQVVSELLVDWDPASETLVLSAENFCPGHAAPLRTLLPRDAHYTVVLVVRRQDAWIDSYFNQLTKTNDFHGPIESFVRDLHAPDSLRLCNPDWEAHFLAWRTAFGSCEVVFFDESRLNVFGAFLRAAGLGALPELRDIARAQEGLDIFQTAYLMDIERPLAQADFYRHRRAGAAAATRLGIAHRPYSLLHPDLLAQVRVTYAPSNAKLLAAVGRPGDQGVLNLETGSSPFLDLRQFYASPDYARFRLLAKELFIRSAAPTAGA